MQHKQLAKQLATPTFVRSVFHSKLVRYVLALSLLQPAFCSALFAASESFQVRREDPSIRSGGVYYSPNKKNDVLFKANVWGSVQYPGVHFLPLGTRFVDALSIAGGPLDTANTSEITLSSRLSNGETKIREIDIQDALAKQDFNPVLQPEDVIVVKENKTVQKTQMIVTIGTFILSIATFALVAKDR